jgi:hypothetical protein
MHLLLVEMRRALHRRFVWGLLALAGCGVVLLGVLALTTSSGKSPAQLALEGDHPAIMASWWTPGEEGMLMLAAIPLLVGGLLGGASVGGAEWRAGTVTTVLTWEPDRLRLQAARTAACFLLAGVIAFVLQALFLGAAMPAVLAHGSTAGTDAQYWADLLFAMGRVSLLTATTAVLGFSLATIGRNTAFALVGAFGWMAIAESLVRGLKPEWADLLVGENIAIVTAWSALDDADFTRSGPAALVTLLLYVGAIALAAAALFRTRDVAGSA